MSSYEYKVVPAPQRGQKARGVRTPEARFANTLEGLLNRMAGEGWEYQRAELLPSEERSGLAKTNTVWRNVLIFRRPVEAEEEAEEPRLLEAPAPGAEGPPVHAPAFAVAATAATTAVAAVPEQDEEVAEVEEIPAEVEVEVEAPVEDLPPPLAHTQDAASDDAGEEDDYEAAEAEVRSIAKGIVGISLGGRDDDDEEPAAKQDDPAETDENGFTRRTISPLRGFGKDGDDPAGNDRS